MSRSPRQRHAGTQVSRLVLLVGTWCVACTGGSNSGRGLGEQGDTVDDHDSDYTLRIDAATALHSTGSHFLGLALGSWDKLAQGPNHHLPIRSETPGAPLQNARTHAPNTVTTHGPNTDVTTHGPNTDVTTHGPNTDVTTHGPNTDVTTHAPNSDVTTHAPNTTAAAHQQYGYQAFVPRSVLFPYHISVFI